MFVYREKKLVYYLPLLCQEIKYINLLVFFFKTEAIRAVFLLWLFFLQMSFYTSYFAADLPHVNPSPLLDAKLQDTAAQIANGRNSCLEKVTKRLVITLLHLLGAMQSMQ